MLEQDRIIKINIEEEMKTSYIDYSMSVIVARALPDVRDGFKPVHRRILYGMMELGNTSDKPYKNQPESSVRSLVNITLMAIPQYMGLWFVWLRIGRCVIHWSMDKETSVRSTVIALRRCVIPRPA